MTKKKAPDRRIARSQRLLRDALVALVIERGWDEVSVQDVCARADVGRSTFYAHFADKEELLLSGFEALSAALHAERARAAGTFAFAEHLIEHARDNQRLFRAVVGRRSGKVVEDRFRGVVLEIVDAELAARGLAGPRRTALARYATGGFIELLAGWLERPTAMAPADLAALFRTWTSGLVELAAR
ncbi:TetR/AcrR family transcriptional regulator [Myxococcota bacterium]|nr:TetR/AcrR family transcriptional regulator [Myxococcota bacterium]